MRQATAREVVFNAAQLASAEYAAENTSLPILDPMSPELMR
jgi:hypothetical protein